MPWPWAIAERVSKPITLSPCFWLVGSPHGMCSFSLASTNTRIPGRTSRQTCEPSGEGRSSTEWTNVCNELQHWLKNVYSKHKNMIWLRIICVNSYKNNDQKSVRVDVHRICPWDNLPNNFWTSWSINLDKYSQTFRLRFKLLLSCVPRARPRGDFRLTSTPKF